MGQREKSSSPDLLKGTTKMIRIALSSIITLLITVSIYSAVDETAPITIALLVAAGFVAGAFVQYVSTYSNDN